MTLSLECINKFVILVQSSILILYMFQRSISSLFSENFAVYEYNCLHITVSTNSSLQVHKSTLAVIHFYGQAQILGLTYIYHNIPPPTHPQEKTHKYRKNTTQTTRQVFACSIFLSLDGLTKVLQLVFLFDHVLICMERNIQGSLQVHPRNFFIFCTS